MEHSIASPRVNTRASSVLIGLSSAVGTGARKLGSGIARLRASWRADIGAPIDADRIAAELAIERRARADGKAELPPSTDEVVAGTQREIAAHFNELQRRAQRQAAALTDKMRARRDRIDLADAAGNLREIAARCEDKLMRLAAASRARLDLLEERESQQQQHYAAFREANRLDRVAEYPRSPLINVALAAALIAAQAFVIGRISAEGGGALVPASWAVSFALAGVLVPFGLAATIFRSINHVSQSKRSAAWLGGAAAAAFVGALAVFAAYYVAATGTNPGISPLGVIDQIRLDPVASISAVAADTAAWTTFAVAAAIGALAFAVGYKSDDPYPGYGSVQRAFYRARGQRERLVARLRRRINSITDRARAEATAAPKRLKAEVKRYSRLVEDAKRIPARMSEYNAALEDTCNILLDRYRAINAGVRRTEAPTSFSEQVCFGREPASSTLGNDDAWLQEFDRGIAELEREAADVRRKLKELHWSALAGLTGAPADAEQYASR